MQCGPEHLGECVRILLASDDADRLVQLCEGRRQRGGVSWAAKRKVVARVNIAS